MSVRIEPRLRGGAEKRGQAGGGGDLCVHLLAHQGPRADRRRGDRPAPAGAPAARRLVGAGAPGGGYRPERPHLARAPPEIGRRRVGSNGTATPGSIGSNRTAITRCTSSLAPSISCWIHPSKRSMLSRPVWAVAPQRVVAPRGVAPPTTPIAQPRWISPSSPGNMPTAPARGCGCAPSG